MEPDPAGPPSAKLPRGTISASMRSVFLAPMTGKRKQRPSLIYWARRGWTLAAQANGSPVPRTSHLGERDRRVPAGLDQRACGRWCGVQSSRWCRAGPATHPSVTRFS